MQHRHSQLAAAAALVLTSFACVAAFAQPDAGVADAPISPHSPQAVVADFFEQTRLGNYEAAARHLELPAGADPETLAFRVKAALNRYLWVDVEALSPVPEGKLDDQLRPQLEEIGVLETPAGLRVAVRLARGGDGWHFTRGTVSALDRVYQSMPDRLLLERVPEPLLRTGPADLMWWQWLVLPLLALLCGLLGRLFAYVTRRVLLRITRKTEAHWDDALVQRMTGPLALLWGVAIGYAALPHMVLALPARDKLDTVLQSGVTFALFWGVLRSVDLAGDLLAVSPLMDGRAARALLPVMTRIAKVVVAALLVIAVLSGLGLPVASLIAGLGVGGIALALAAQKTVENVFGAVSIGVDVPFHVGDFVKIDGMIGTVESIGLRSTRIRTLDRTLVTVPNGGLADTRIENYAARDRMRLFTTLGLEYGTSEAQMRAVLEQLEAALRAHPRIWPDTVIVRFVGFGASSLDIEVMAWFLTQDWNEFTSMRQQILLEFMAIVEANGTSFAFPTRTLHVVQHPPANEG